MRRCMLILAMISFWIPIHVLGGEVDSMIQLHVHCHNGKPCRFTGETIAVELELVNGGEKDVALPLEYFRKQGPKVILVDNHSYKERRLGMGPPMTSLFNRMEVLASGQSIRIPWSIPGHHVSRFALRPVSITVIFRFYLAPGTAQSTKDFVSTQLLVEDGR